jgi:uncharacterized membrane protein YphA (DoxX/SURF4 family)
MIDMTTAPYAALLLHLCLGAIFIAHAMLKVRVLVPKREGDATLSPTFSQGRGRKAARATSISSA